MISCESDNGLVLSWCVGWTFQRLHKELRDRSVKVGRACFITTQLYRVYLDFVPDGLKYVPYEYINGAWRSINKHLTKVKPVDTSALCDYRSLFKAMKFQIILQFRNSIEGYFQDLPDYQEVLNGLKYRPNLSTLDICRYSYYPVEVNNCGNWDGVVEVNCDGGGLLLPYKTDGYGQSSIQTYYATFIPDSIFLNFLRRVLPMLDLVFSIFENIHWSNFRLLIEKWWGRYVR